MKDREAKQVKDQLDRGARLQAFGDIRSAEVSTLCCLILFLSVSMCMLSYDILLSSWWL